MTPTLQTIDTQGHHNARLEESTARIIKGGSWKKQDVVVLIPAGGSVPFDCVLSWMHLQFPPNNQAHKVGAKGLEVGEAYSLAIEQIVAHPVLGAARFLLTLEHDNMPPPDGVLRLLAQMEAHPEFACIGGLYWTKGEGGVPQIWGDPKDRALNFRPQPPDPAGGLP